MKLNDLMTACGDENILVTVFDMTIKKDIVSRVGCRELMDAEGYENIAGRAIYKFSIFVMKDGVEMLVCLN